MNRITYNNSVIQKFINEVFKISIRGKENAKMVEKGERVTRKRNR